MKSLTTKTLVMTLFMLATAQTAKSNENYWELIKQKWTACENATTTEDAEALALEYQSYVQSLNANQLHMAARNCSAEVQRKIAPDHWHEALWALGFFCQNYPTKTNSLGNISPLLTDLQDTSQPTFWRHSIIQMLGVEWRGKFSVQIKQNLQAANIMKQIVSEPSEPMLLRIKAAKISTELYRDVHRSNFEDDPGIKKLIENGQKYSDVINNVRQGQIILTEETIKNNTSVEASIAASIKTQISLLTELTEFDDPNVPAHLEVSLLDSLKDLRDFDNTDQIKRAMNTALHNYKKYDEYLWRYLVRINKIYFENEEAEFILPKMINDAKNEHEKEYTLPELKKKIDKGEIKSLPYTPGNALMRLP